MHADTIAGQHNEYIGLQLSVCIILHLPIDCDVSIEEFLQNRTIPYILNSIWVRLASKSIEKQLDYVGVLEHCLQAWDNQYVSKSVPGLLPSVVPRLIA